MRFSAYASVRIMRGYTRIYADIFTRVGGSIKLSALGTKSSDSQENGGGARASCAPLLNPPLITALYVTLGSDSPTKRVGLSVLTNSANGIHF